MFVWEVFGTNIKQFLYWQWIWDEIQIRQGINDILYRQLLALTILLRQPFLRQFHTLLYQFHYQFRHQACCF